MVQSWLFPSFRFEPARLTRDHASVAAGCELVVADSFAAYGASAGYSAVLPVANGVEDVLRLQRHLPPFRLRSVWRTLVGLGHKCNCVPHRAHLALPFVMTVSSGRTWRSQVRHLGPTRAYMLRCETVRCPLILMMYSWYSMRRMAAVRVDAWRDHSDCVTAF